MPVVNIPKILRERLTEEGAEALVELFNQTEEDVRDAIVRFSEEKYERRLTEVAADLKADFEEKITNVKIELHKEIANVKTELIEKIANVKAELQKEIANVKANIIKWMFIFWVGQIGSLIGILWLFFKK